MLRVRMSLQMLREEMPEWSWRAVRHGMGWRYDGHRGAHRVTLMRVGVIVGEDDVSSRWMVYETGETYATWYIRERLRLTESSK